MPTAEETAQKSFDAQDKQWEGPRLFRLAIVTLFICISTIYLMSRTGGCSLQIVP